MHKIPDHVLNGVNHLAAWNICGLIHFDSKHTSSKTSEVVGQGKRNCTVPKAKS